MKTLKKLLLLTLTSSAMAFEYQYLVEPGKTVCFEDFLTNDTHLIYGYTPVDVSTVDDISQALAPVHAGYAGRPQAAGRVSADDGRGRLLQSLRSGQIKVQKKMTENRGFYKEKRKILSRKKVSGKRNGNDGQKACSVSSRRRKLLPRRDVDTILDQVLLEDQKVVQAKKNEKIEKSENEELNGMGAFYKDPSGVSKKKYAGPGILTITNSNDVQLSPSTIRPYSLYKLTISRPFDTVYVCYESLVETDTLVRLTYRFRDKSLFEEMPSKDESSDLMSKLNKVEHRFEQALSAYEELQEFETQFVSKSSDTLASFMTLSQILLLGYLIVTWLLKLIIEKTLRYKKII